MTKSRFAFNLFLMACILAAMTTIGGCVNYGQSLMISKGKAGAVQAVFGANGEFCKITASDGVVLTNADHEAFAKYCGEE